MLISDLQDKHIAREVQLEAVSSASNPNMESLVEAVARSIRGGGNVNKSPKPSQLDLFIDNNMVHVDDWFFSVEKFFICSTHREC